MPSDLQPVGRSVYFTYGPGGGRVGAVLIGTGITPGSTSDTAYNHYSLLRTFEDLYGVTHLGFAGQAGLSPFGADVFAGGPPHSR